MNAFEARSGLTTKIKVALAAIAAACLMLAISASGAKAAQGDPFNAEFNYVGLNVGISLSSDPLDELVLTPETVDGDDNPVPPLKLQGQYTDNAGNFTLPKATGLVFPPLEIDIEGIKVGGAISLADDATGNYNETTGALDMNMKLSLILGADEIKDLGLPLPGDGPLKCDFQPLDVDFSTGNGWPHPGKAFEDKANLTDGAVAGAWTYKPNVNAIEGDAFLCDAIAGFLEPVGGIWMANSSTPIAEMPPATSTKPSPLPCPEGTTGSYPNCKPIPVEECAADETGTPPDCKKIVQQAKITKVAVAPKKKTVKAGKKLKITVKVTNKGNAAKTVTVKLKSNNKRVKVPKQFKVKVGAGKTVAKKVTVNVTKKAKGKARITATADKKTGKSVLTVKKAKKKKRK